MTKPRSNLSMLAAALGFVAGSGRDVLDMLCQSAAPPSFGQRYGNNPRSTGNGGQGRGNVARMKRAARKRRNIRKHRRGAA